MIALEHTEKENVPKQNREYCLDAWRLADEIQLEVCMVQDVQKVYFNDVSQLSFAEESKEDTEQRLAMLYFVGESILRHMDEIQNGLTTLMPLIQALQNDIE